MIKDVINLPIEKQDKEDKNLQTKVKTVFYEQPQTLEKIQEMLELIQERVTSFFRLLIDTKEGIWKEH